MQVGGEHEGRREGQPAIEILAVRAVAPAEAAHRQEAQDSCRASAITISAGSASPVRDPEARTTGTSVEPDCGEGYRDQCEGDTQRPLPRGHPPARPRCRRDQRQCENAARDGRPGLGRPNRIASEHRRDGEAEARRRGSREARAQKQVESAALDGEPNAGEDGDDRGRQHDPRVEGERMRGARTWSEVRVGQKERQGSAEEADEQKLADEPRLVGVTVVTPHVALIGCRAPADKRSDDTEHPSRGRPSADP